MSDLTYIKQKAEEIGVKISDEQAGQLETYYHLLVEKNEVMNLTAITEFEEVVEKHFVDSLSLVKIRDLSGDLTLLDVGTGAGFPGMVLKICFPNLKITLLDSLQKRIFFLEEIAEKLGLQDLTCIHGRCEDLCKADLSKNPGSLRESFDICVSRAVANLSTLSEYALPFVKVGGDFIPYKAGGCEEEIEAAGKAIETLGGKLIRKEEFLLPGTEISRTLLQIRKEKETPKAYPRKAGVAAKKPL